MGMVICSLETLKEHHEIAKKYECYEEVLEQQKEILETVEKFIKDEDTTTCLEHYEYKLFTDVREPKELVRELMNCFGDEEILELVHEVLTENINSY